MSLVVYTNDTDNDTPHSPHRKLSDHHQHMLEVESGIHPDIIAARGYWTAYTADDCPVGFADYQMQAWMFPALVIPQWNTVGRISAYILRPDHPRRGKDDKVIKYEAQPGAPVGFDVPPTMRQQLADETIPLYITEGSKKADAMASRGLLCLSLNGVYGFMHHRVVVSELDEINLEGRTVRIVFDSDVMTKSAVADALNRLAGAGDRRGGRVELVILPDAGDGKTGVDDYFGRGGTADDLASLTRPWKALRRPTRMIEYEDPYAEIDRLRRLNSAQARLIRNPYLKEKERAVGFAVITRAAEKIARGDVGPDGKPRLRASEIAEDYRERPEKGTPLPSTNKDGSVPITKRSNVKPIINALREAEILTIDLEGTKRQASTGDTYADIDFVVDLDDPVAAIVRLSDYRREKTRAPYTRQEPCRHCGEVHSRTRRTYCDGCGMETEKPQVLPVPAANNPDATPTQRERLAERTADPDAPREVIDFDTGEVISTESGSTKKVEADTNVNASSSPLPVNYSSTNFVEAEGEPAATCSDLSGCSEPVARDGLRCPAHSMLGQPTSTYTLEGVAS